MRPLSRPLGEPLRPGPAWRRGPFGPRPVIGAGEGHGTASFPLPAAWQGPVCGTDNPPATTAAAGVSWSAGEGAEAPGRACPLPPASERRSAPAAAEMVTALGTSHPGGRPLPGSGDSSELGAWKPQPASMGFRSSRWRSRSWPRARGLAVVCLKLATIAGPPAGPPCNSPPAAFSGNDLIVAGTELARVSG